MTSQTLFELLIGVAVLGLLVVRQLRARPVRSNTRVLLILGVIGVIEAAGFLQKQHATGIVVAALAGSLVLAAVFGVIRAATVKLWLQDGQPWSKGTVLTAVLWVVALAAHLGYDALLGRHHQVGSVASATVVLYLAVSFAVQRAVVLMRANQLNPSGFASSGTAL
jgi:hypothetical protein